MRLSTIFSIIIVLGLLGLGYMHEQVHVQIYAGYGIDSHVEYLSHFPDLVTIAESGCPTEECTLAHSINEIVSYPLSIFYIVLTSGILIIIILKEVEE